MLELGCGDYSTPVLASIATSQSRKLSVVGSEQQWLAKYRYLVSPDIELRLVNEQEWPRIDLSGKWGFVLLDNEQRVSERLRLLKRLAMSAKVVVLHDSNVLDQSGGSWQPVLRLFQHVYFNRRHIPSTAVLSNEIDPKIWFPASYA